MTPMPPPFLSSVDHINAALKVAVAQSPPAAGMLHVCHATEAEWNSFVGSDGQIVPNGLLTLLKSTSSSLQAHHMRGTLWN